MPRKCLNQKLGLPAVASGWRVKAGPAGCSGAGQRRALGAKHPPGTLRRGPCGRAGWIAQPPGTIAPPRTAEGALLHLPGVSGMSAGTHIFFNDKTFLETGCSQSLGVLGVDPGEGSAPEQALLCLSYLKYSSPFLSKTNQNKVSLN